MEVVVDPRTSRFTSEIVHVKTVKDSAENRPLSNTVTHSEDVGEHSITSNIGKLKHVDDDEDSEEDLGKSCTKEFLE